jgi:hypothetical protein
MSPLERRRWEDQERRRKEANKKEVKLRSRTSSFKAKFQTVRKQLSNSNAKDDGVKDMNQESRRFEEKENENEDEAEEERGAPPSKQSNSSNNNNNKSTALSRLVGSVGRFLLFPKRALAVVFVFLAVDMALAWSGFKTVDTSADWSNFLPKGKESDVDLALFLFPPYVIGHQSHTLSLHHHLSSTTPPPPPLTPAPLPPSSS